MRTLFRPFLVLVASVFFITAPIAATSETASAGSRDVAQGIRSVQIAIRNRRWPEARKGLKSLEMLQTSPEEQYDIGELKAYLRFRQNKLAAAAAGYARLLQAPYAPNSIRWSRTKAVAEMYFQAGDYTHALKYGTDYLDHLADDVAVAVLVADSYLRLHDYRQSAASMTSAIDRAEAAHRIPQESWLRIAENAYYGAGDEHGQRMILRKLVRYYDCPEDWRSLLALDARSAGDMQLEFGYLRLKFAMGMLSGRDEFETLILESMAEGMPGKAKAVLARAEKSHVFSEGRYERLHHAISRQSPDRPELLSHEVNRANLDPSGESDAVVGKMLLDESHYGQAISALQRSLQKGGGHDLRAVQINLGIAYLRDNQLCLAHDAFAGIPADSKWANLAGLWVLNADNTELRVSAATS